MVTAMIFMKHWIVIFGAPKTVFLGNGGQFIGESFVEMCEQFQQEVHGVTAYVKDQTRH